MSLLLLILLPEIAQSGEEGKIDAIIEQGKPVWLEVRKLQQNLVASFDSTSMLNGKKSRVKFNYRYRSDCALCEQQFLDDSNNLVQAIVRAYNPQYSFQLERKAGTLNWVAQDLSLRRTKEDSLPDYARNLDRPVYLLATAVVDVPLEEFLTSERIEIVKVTQLSDEITEIEFVNHTPASVTNKKELEGFFFSKGKISLDGRHAYCVAALKLESTTNGKTYSREYRVEYSNLAPQAIIPVISKSSYSLARNGGAVEKVIESEYSAIAEVPKPTLPVREFTLSNFGLPEPPNTNILATAIPYWLIATVVGALFIGLGLYFRKQQTMN